MRTLLTLADRTAVLFLGIAAGVAIGYAFGVARVPAQRATVTAPAVAPPPPAAEGGGPSATVTTPAPRPIVPQQAPELAQPVQRHLLGSLAEGRKVRVGVFGDSYGDGIWSALYRLLPAKAGYEVVKFSQQSTGFTRYASLNLEEHAREQLSGNPVDVAVISFGANDTQGVLVGRHAAPLLSPEWQEVVGKRVDGFVRELRAQGATVYWVGLPKMRKPSFDADIAGMNAFYAKRMAALGVPWIETASMTVDENGAFAPYLPDGPKGERTLIRANDGIHMSMTGYVRITRGLAKRIGDYVAVARAKAGVVAPSPVAAPSRQATSLPSTTAPAARVAEPAPKRSPAPHASPGRQPTGDGVIPPKRSALHGLGAEISQRAAAADRATAASERRVGDPERQRAPTSRRAPEANPTAAPIVRAPPEIGRPAGTMPKRAPGAAAASTEAAS